MNRKLLFWLSAFAFVATFARAMSPSQLQQAMTNGTKLTIIDVRNTEIYQRAHIPGAINVPAALCPDKKLPPLGRVIAYDDGLGNNTAVGAVTALNAKPGISAEILDGGFAGWEALNFADTRGRGAEKQLNVMLTYQQVKTNLTDDIVLVDLRKATPAKAGEKALPLSSLQTEFPQARVSSTPFKQSGKRKSSSGETLPPLLVLVDKGDGAAEEMARTLRGNGITRFVILAGGEEAITRQGQPGSKRSGYSVPVVTPTTTTSN
jgi:rhodanese-related sulfurtransferase